jgi:hypothetical protein
MWRRLRKLSASEAVMTEWNTNELIGEDSPSPQFRSGFVRAKTNPSNK